jgi:predicted small metal-binding protein
MGKEIHCYKVNPVPECYHVIRGDIEEVLDQAKEHAKEHDVYVTAGLIEILKGFIEDE